MNHSVFETDHFPDHKIDQVNRDRHLQKRTHNASFCAVLCSKDFKIDSADVETWIPLLWDMNFDI